MCFVLFCYAKFIVVMYNEEDKNYMKKFICMQIRQVYKRQLFMASTLVSNPNTKLYDNGNCFRGFINF